MVQVFVHGGDTAGQWLTMVEGEAPIIGAYVEPYMGSDPKLTIFWKGLVQAGAFVAFCKDVTDATPDHAGAAELQGWAFAAGRPQKFFGQAWLKAAEVGSPRFLRFERRGAETAEVPEFILWGRNADVSAPDDGEEENIGVRIRTRQVPGFGPSLVTLISATRLGNWEGATIQRALQSLSEHLG